MRYALVFVLSLQFIGLSAQVSKLYGTVTDEEGKPYSFIELELDGTDLKVISDEDGEYLFDAVEIGDYALVIKHPYGSVYRAIYMDGADLEYNVQIRRRIAFDEVTVKATRATSDEPINKQDLGVEFIESRDFSQDMPYTFKSLPSVVVNSDAGTGIGYTGIRVRGLDPSHVNITLNGVPVNDSESQLVFWVNMPDLVSSTQSIQIQRGIGGSTFGAGDFGASINLNTNQVRPKAYVDVKLGGGSFNTLRGTLALGTGLMNNKFTLDGRLSYISSDGYIDRARADLTSFMVSGAWIGLNSSLRLNVLNGHEVTYQAWNGVPVQYADDEDLRTFNAAGQEAVEALGSPYDDEVDNYTQTHVQLIYNRVDDLGDWSATLHYTRGLGFFELYQAEEDLIRYNGLFADTAVLVNDLVERRWLDNHFIGVNSSWGKSFGKLDLRGALAYNYYDGVHFGETVRIVDFGVFDPPRKYYENVAGKHDFNAFFKSLYSFNDQWKAYLDLQYRNVNYNYEGEVRFDREVVGEAQFNFFNPKVGLTYLPTENSKVFAFFGRGSKEPNRDDFIDNPRNQQPQAEYMNNAELGWSLDREKWGASLNTYWMGYEDQLVLTGQINDVGEYARTNVDESYRRGVEIDLRAEIFKGLTLSANANWSQNVISEFLEYIDNWDTGEQEVRVFENTTMAFAPEWIAFAGLAYLWNSPFNFDADGALQVAIEHKYVGEQFLDNTESVQASLPEFLYADLSLQYRTKLDDLRIKELVWSFKINNLYNTLYSTNGWNYRFVTQDPNAIQGDPYGRAEGNNVFTLTGLFPQATRHFQTTLALNF